MAALSSSRREEIAGYLFILPWLIGFLVFQLGSMIASLVLSFYSVDFLTAPTFVGLANFQTLWSDARFWHALGNTAYYALGRMPFVLALGLSIALLLNRERQGVSFLRTLFYLPSVTSGVAVALLWIWILNPDYGLMNAPLRELGLPAPAWMYSEEWAMPSLILISLWSVGGSMIIYLAGLRSIPAQLYEAAALDGASGFVKFWHVTVPMLTPTIFYNLIVGIIASFQVFLNSYVITGGGPNDATLTMVLYLYRKGFQEFHMGYASALAWALFLVILVFTTLVFRSSHAWVYYEADLKKTGRGG